MLVVKRRYLVIEWQRTKMASFNTIKLNRVYALHQDNMRTIWA